ncbi:MAG: hypothetical protein AB7V25_11250 [Mangrovibacterium sp.]
MHKMEVNDFQEKVCGSAGNEEERKGVDKKRFEIEKFINFVLFTGSRGKPCFRRLCIAPVRRAGKMQ